MNDNQAPIRFFFGEEYRVFDLHVTHAAWINVAVDLSFILLFSVVFNVFVGYFDAFSIVLVFLFSSVLLSAVYGLFRYKHFLIYPILVCKAVDAVISLVLLLIAFILAVVSRKTLLHVIGWRLRTLTASTASLHIVFFFSYLFGQLIYSLVSLYVFSSALYYIRSRAIFAYEVRRRSRTAAFLGRLLGPRGVAGAEHCDLSTGEEKKKATFEGEPKGESTPLFASENSAA